MDEYNSEGDQGRCYVHMAEGVAGTGPGVCPLCLNERLLVLAASKHRTSHLRKPSISLIPSFFAFGAFLHRLHKSSSDPRDYSAVSTSPEDSFISIKIEGNGVASWEKNTASSKDSESIPVERHSLHCKSRSRVSSKLTNVHVNETTKSVVERPQPVASLRWRKRIGHIFQLIRLKRSSNINRDVSQVGGKVEGLKLRRKGWIRRLTQRRPRGEGQEL